VLIGACCFEDGRCQNVSEADCDSLGGIWHYPDTCETYDCPQPPVGACCFEDGTCQNLQEADCAAMGGIWHYPDTCETYDCPQPPTGACCHGEICTIETQRDCESTGGTYKGDGVPCEDDTCVPVATQPSTWGKIKAGYR
jgi:hypothetical protein